MSKYGNNNQEHVTRYFFEWSYMEIAPEFWSENPY